MMLDAVISFFLIAGAAFALLGSLGLARFPDFFTRLHGPSKATTLGIGGMLVAWALYPLSQGESASLRPLLITVFLFITAPVSAHLLAKAAIALRVRSMSALPPTNVDEENNCD
jgi:multicomponent K+:H+ antiporter subunit G